MKKKCLVKRSPVPRSRTTYTTVIDLKWILVLSAHCESLLHNSVYFLFVFFNSANKAQQGHLQLTLENHIFVVKEMLFNGKDFIDGFIWDQTCGRKKVLHDLHVAMFS